MKKIHKMLHKIIPIAVIVLFSSMMLTLAAEAQQEQTNPQSIDGQIKKYPPYPDVWHREYMAKSMAEAADDIPDLLGLSNGDVLYLYYERLPSKAKKDDYDLISHQATYFGGRTVINAESNLRILRGQQRELVLNDGTKVSVTKEDKNRRLGRHKLSNGVEVVSVDSYSAQGKCDHGPIDNYFYTIDEKKGKGKYKPKKIIFILLDKPKHYMWDNPKPIPGSDVEVDPCTEEGPPGYATRVKTVWGRDVSSG